MNNLSVLAFPKVVFLARCAHHRVVNRVRALGDTPGDVIVNLSVCSALSRLVPTHDHEPPSHTINWLEDSTRSYFSHSLSDQINMIVRTTAIVALSMQASAFAPQLLGSQRSLEHGPKVPVRMGTLFGKSRKGNKVQLDEPTKEDIEALLQEDAQIEENGMELNGIAHDAVDIDAAVEAAVHVEANNGQEDEEEGEEEIDEQQIFDENNMRMAIQEAQAMYVLNSWLE